MSVAGLPAEAVGGRGTRGKARSCPFCLYALIFAAWLFRPVGALAQGPPGPRELLKQLDSAAIDPTQVYVLRNARLTRDRVNFYFNRGFIAFLTKTQGECTGAVFSGEGEVLLVPPDLVEKRNLALFTGSPILEERFTAAYLSFTDKTAQELLAAARRPDPEDSEQPPDFASQWNAALRTLNPASSTRVLANLLGDRPYTFFRARIYAVSRPAFDVVIDECFPEAVTVASIGRTGEDLYSDIWCSFASKTSQARSDNLLKGPARVLSYNIQTRIQADHSLGGRAELLLESLSSSVRVLGFQLSRWLKVSKVEDESGQNLVVFQYPSAEESDTGARRDDWIEVVLPALHPVGERFRLFFTYQGNVIADVGNGVLYVGARGSWYPNRPLSAPATYDLTFDYPQNLTLVATGTRLEESSSGDWTHSHWQSNGGFRVAGFNLGPYHIVRRRTGKTLVEVYATKEAEAALEKRHEARAPVIIEMTPRRGEGHAPLSVISPLVAPLAPAGLLEHVAKNAADAIEYYQKQFGAFPYPRVAIAQIPGNFGQGWPELVYLPTLSFLPEAERSAMGFIKTEDDLLTRSTLAHEIAHQWWGNLLGWKTYHDQWLSEGLASYAGVLWLAQEKDGERKSRELLQIFKRDLLRKTQAGSTVESGGPIWLGERLSNSLNPDGYSNIVYKKACWILHMLHDLMTDPASGSEERFSRMLRDFLAAHRDEEVSTEDFIHHAEKYMTRAMDLDHDERLDWFFKEWVYNTGIPTYQLASKTRRLGPDKFLVQGTIEQTGVSSDFEMLVPVVAMTSKNKRVRLGRVAVGDSGGHFRFTTTSKPEHVMIDEDNLLAVVH
jgi:hypothetical protein